jgi:hypothetical protein
MLPKLKLLSGVLVALALSGCAGESKEQKAGPPKGDEPPKVETKEAPRPQNAGPVDEKQARAIAAVERLGGKVQFDENSPGRPVCSIDFSDAKISDKALKNLDSLPQLKVLILSGTRVTDAGLVHLEGLRLLTGLMLDGTPVTDAGLQYLDDLSCLERLGLIGTRVTDAGLEHLKRLKRLRGISLMRTKVTNAGVRDLRQALPRANISH